MLTLKEWMEVVDYKITEGSQFQWTCFGSDAYTLDSWNGDNDAGYSFSITFDTKDQTVYQVEAFDYRHNRAYRMIHPDFQSEYKQESANLGTDEAWDDVRFVDLEVDDDFIQKCLAIKSGEDYDTRVSIPLDFIDEELLKYMTMAHERDMTFNQFIEEALRNILNDLEKDPESVKQRVEKWKNK